MHHLRRVVTTLTSLALLQLMLLGSAMPCAVPSAEGGTHAEHVQHADTGRSGNQIAAEPTTERLPPVPDCAIRACSSSPVLLAESEVTPSNLRASDGVMAVSDERPATPFQPLEPPPPRV